MNESNLQVIALLKLLILVIVSGLYAWGGMSGKWKRRFIAPFVLVSSICVFSIVLDTFNFWYLAYYPLLMGSLTIGYGADETKEKVKKRAIYALAVSCASIPLVVINQCWLLFGIHVALCLIVNILLGVFNPMHARNEETVLGLMTGLVPIFMV